MNGLEDRKVACPWCGEVIDIIVDTSVPQQRYIEDCQVCCRPIIFDVTIDLDGDISVSVATEND